jgi:hypothetical protein
MMIDKQQILDLLKQRGDHQAATQAESELPAQVDSNQAGGLLEKFGIKPEDFLGAGGGIGGLLK